jgi:hypothetical protein
MDVQSLDQSPGIRDRPTQQCRHGFTELTGGGRTDAAPAAALVGPQHNYLFVVIKGLDGNLYVNQGELGKPFTGWQ